MRFTSGWSIHNNGTADGDDDGTADGGREDRSGGHQAVCLFINHRSICAICSGFYVASIVWLVSQLLVLCVEWFSSFDCRAQSAGAVSGSIARPLAPDYVNF